MAQFTWPLFNSSSGVVKFNLNGSVTSVSKDTATPSNSIPLPVSILNSGGSLADLATSAKQDTGNSSLSSIDGKLTSGVAIVGALTRAKTGALANSLVVKASAGKLYLLTGYNSLTTDQFIQIHDSAAVPANGAVPEYSFLVQASSNFSIDAQDIGLTFLNGIAVCNSTTVATKTIGAANCWIVGEYI